MVSPDDLVTEYCPHCEEETQHYYEKGRGWVCVSCNMTGSEGSGCLISTVVCANTGLGPNCRELQVLRRFRDSYMMETDGRRELVREYYRKAPMLVRLLVGDPRKEQISRILYQKFVVKAVDYVELGKCEEALREYSEMVDFLSREVDG